MPSSLRNEVFPTTIPANPLIRSLTQSSPIKQQKMSLTQTYFLAHTARGKLSKEAARGDHDLRLLVGHANLLDGLMLDLAHAEEEQESWFNKTVQSNTKTAEEPKHIKWADTIPEEFEEAIEEDLYAESSDSDSESDDDEEDIDLAPVVPAQKAERLPVTISASGMDEDEEMEDEEYDDDLALTRTSSIHPPELLHEDSDSESDDDSMPPSPPSAELPYDPFSEKQRQAIATTSFYQSIPAKSDAPASLPVSEQASLFDEEYYLPQRQTAIAAY